MKVLLIDDDLEWNGLVKTLLAPMGTVVTTTQQGGEAANLAANCLPDIIVLDWSLDEGDRMDPEMVKDSLRASPVSANTPILLATRFTDSLQCIDHNGNPINIRDSYLSIPRGQTVDVLTAIQAGGILTTAGILDILRKMELAAP